MRKRRWYLASAALVAVAALGVGAGLASAGSSGTKLTKVTLQLKWVDAGPVRRLLRGARRRATTSRPAST